MKKTMDVVVAVVEVVVKRRKEEVKEMKNEEKPKAVEGAETERTKEWS